MAWGLRRELLGEVLLREGSLGLGGFQMVAEEELTVTPSCLAWTEG